MYRDVTELTRDELIELKQNYLIQLSDCGEYAEIMGVEWDAPSWGELAAADEIISDEIVFEHYSGIGFVEEDFFCNLESNERGE